MKCPGRPTPTTSSPARRPTAIATTDRVIGSVEESRCNQFNWVSAASDGTAYFSPAAYYAPLRSLLGASSGVDTCALRILPGADRFEPGYALDLQALTGGRPAGDFFLASDSTAFLRVWHSELVTSSGDDEQNWETILQEPGFLWWTWQVGAEQAERGENAERRNEHGDRGDDPFRVPETDGRSQLGSKCLGGHRHGLAV